MIAGIWFADEAWSQASLEGMVQDTGGEAVPFANAVLYQQADSQMVKAEVTDMDGHFQLMNIPAGTYRLEVSFVGFSDYVSDNIILGEKEKRSLPLITMATDENVLDAVEIVSERSLIEIQPDKTVFNVDGSANATGNTALELLRKAPGVMVDNNDNIVLMGKSGTVVYIDGKPSPLSGADLAAFLNALRSEEIDAIEIITNPSAKYDAEGDAGIINIRLKKNKAFGTNANINLGYNQGFYAKYNGSLNVNYRNKFMNVFGGYNFNVGTWRNTMDIYRIQSGQIFDASSVRTASGPFNGLKFGTDFFVGDKSTIGFLVNGGKNVNNWNSLGVTPIYDLASGEQLTTLRAISDNDGYYFNSNYNMNYRYDDKNGITWNADVDFGQFEITNDTYQPNYYVDPLADTVTAANIFTFTAPTNIDIYSAKLDHERPFLGGKLGLGVKSNYVTTNNTYTFYEVIDNEEILDPDRSNNFVYQENVQAAYFSFVRDIKKFGINLGLRVEQTHSIGTLTSQQDLENDEVERKYTDFFPSGGLTYKLNDKNQLRLNYSRRIQRPNYDALNPFEFKMDELTYRRGNPFLQPQYTNSVQLTHTFAYMLNTSLNYSYTRDFFSPLSDTTEGTRTYLETVNLGYQRNIGLNISAPFSPVKWWSTYTNLGVYNLENGGQLDDGRDIKINVTSFNVYHQSTFNVGPKTSLEVSGWFGSPSVWGAVFQTEANWSMDIGVQQKLLKDRGNLKLAFTDVFHTAPWDAIQELPGLYMDLAGGWESQQIRLTFSYILGNQQVKAARNRKTGIEDASGRVGSGDGQ